MPHRPTDEDKKLWKHVTKGIKPYHTEEMSFLEQSRPNKHKQIESKNNIDRQQDIFVPRKKVTLDTSHVGPQTLDYRTETRLKRGQIQIEGRIDLHGMTQDEAHNTLIGFISQSCQQGKRCVLVITGKGRLYSPGKIRQNLSDWLYDYPLTGMVLRHVPAQPADGGAGAFYVYLKRQKD